jgi:hypothetical protein
MKKLPLFIIACLLVSVTTWAGWSQPKLSSQTKYLFAKFAPPISCSADGKTIYVSYLTPDFANQGSGYCAVILYKSTDGGETWAEQIMSPGLNPAK